MMNLLSFFIPTAYADVAPAAAPTTASSPWGTIIMLLAYFAIFYFLLIRPQSKRAKEQRQLLANLGKGDEVMTAGGIMGRVADIEDTTISLEIAPNVSIRIQKSSVTANLPKGSLK